VPHTRPRNVLVLAPHPDDETFGCGGTIRMLTSSEVAVDVAFMTRGEQGNQLGREPSAEERRTLAEIREREARAACEILGVRQPFFLEGNDTRLNTQPQLAGRIAELLAAEGYQRVFCPWPQDAHEDHQATFSLLCQALRISTSQTASHFWLYEVWKPLTANTFVPIDHTIDGKRQAMAQYKSQLAQLNYSEAFAGLAAYRSLFCPASTYAEAFLVCDRAEMLKLA
jgi:LmbE family N-acetylglucosaminyl deacetylase